MTTFLAYIWRFMVVSLGFVAAMVVSISVFFAAAAPAGLFNPPDPTSFFEMTFDAAAMMFYVLVFTATLVVVPVFILAVLSEIFGWRGFLTYGVTGALIGCGGVFFAPTLTTSAALMASVASGIAGAWVYWLIAGRNAGKLFERILAERQQ
jgi:hypothetical protein